MSMSVLLRLHKLCFTVATLADVRGTSTIQGRQTSPLCAVSRCLYTVHGIPAGLQQDYSRTTHLPLHAPDVSMSYQSKPGTARDCRAILFMQQGHYRRRAPRLVLQDAITTQISFLLLPAPPCRSPRSCVSVMTASCNPDGHRKRDCSALLQEG